ncbi:MAG: 4Fe-4S binding protein [Phycisphaerae bacterium]
MRHLLVLCLMAAVLLPSAFAVAQVPGQTPQFEEYEIPETETPDARHTLWEYLDVGVLVLFMLAAGWLVLVVRKRIWIAVLMVGALLWFGFIRLGCVCSIGAVQNVSAGLCDPGYYVPLAIVAFFAIPVLFSLIHGRTFCAAVCPLGAIQDLFVIKPIRVPRWLEGGLSMMAWVYLGLAVILAGVGGGFLICRYDPFVSFFRLLPVGQWLHMAGVTGAVSGQQGFTGRVDMLLLALGIVFLLVGVFIARPYCRFLCPLGAIFRVTSRFSAWHAKITPDECVQCRLCEHSCPFNAIDPPTGGKKDKGLVRDKKAVAGLLVISPLVIAVAAALGWLAGEPVSQLHPRVRLADQVWSENLGLVDKPVEDDDVQTPSEAWRAQGEDKKVLYEDAVSLTSTISFATALLGGLLGLMIVGKLIGTYIRRYREGYEPNRSLCLACGRCFEHCPVEKKRRNKIGGVLKS